MGNDGPADPTVSTAKEIRAANASAVADNATTGLAFLLFQTIVVKAVRLTGQVLLAWLLIPEDFGLFMVAATLHQFVSVLKNAGLRDILIHRGAKLHLWSNPAAWMSLALGLAGCLLMWVAAPFIAEFFKDDRLVALVRVLAATTLFQSLGQVPFATMHIRLQFKTSGTIEGVNNILQMLLSLAFAWAGMGAMSFVLPMLIIAILRVGVLWRLVRPKIRMTPQFRRWRYLVFDSLNLISADFGRTLAYQGDYMVMGRAFAGTTAVGLYSYAFQMSSFTVMTLGKNLDTVLFPSLAAMRGDPARQSRAFYRTIRMMALVGVPFCGLQAIAAEPAVRAVLREAFYGSIPYIAILSIGMVPRLLIAPCTSVLRTRGQFRLLSWLAWVFGGCILGCAIAAVVLFDSPIAVAVGVTIAFGVSGLVHMFFALRPDGQPLRKTAIVFGVPTIASAIGCGLAWLAISAMPNETVVWNILRVLAACAIVGVVYIPLVRIFDPEPCKDLIDRVRSVTKKFPRRRSGAGTPSNGEDER